MNPVKQSEFAEWRESHVARWFFDTVESQLRQQALTMALSGIAGKTIGQLALEKAQTAGFIAGALMIESLSYEDLHE